MMLKNILILVLFLGVSVDSWAEIIPFNWQKHSVQVTETRIKENDSRKQTSMKIRYPVELKSHEKGYLVDFGEVEFLEYNGEKLDANTVTIIEKVLGRIAMKPDIIIDKNGAPLEIVDWQEYLTAIGQVNGDNRQIVDNLDNIAELNLLFYQKVLNEPWCHWVCHWSDEDFTREGHTYDYQYDEDFGVDIKGNLELYLLDTKQDWLTVQTDNTQILSGLPDKKLTQSITLDDMKSSQDNKMLRKNIFTAEIHAKTGEPKKVNVVIKIVNDGQERLQERVSYDFDW